MTKPKDSPAPYFRPPQSINVWCDDKFVYAELPTGGSYPYIAKFPLTEGGLHKALALLQDRHLTIAHRESYRIPLNTPKQVQVKSARGKVKMSDEQRSDVNTLLKKLGMLK
jgi:hypothetical protein